MSTKPVTALRPPAWDVVDWKAHWERLAAERDRLATETARLQQEIDALNLRACRELREVNRLHTIASELYDNRDRLREELEGKETHVARLEWEIMGLEQRKVDLVERIRLLQTESDALQSEAECMRAGLDARQADLDARSVELDARNAELDARQSKLDALSIELDSQKAELDTRSDQLSRQVAEQVVQDRLKATVRGFTTKLNRPWYKTAEGITTIIGIIVVVCFFGSLVVKEKRALRIYEQERMERTGR